MREMSIAEILEEEQRAVIHMVARIELLQKTLDPYCEEYFLLQNDRVMLTQTAIYLQRRLDDTLPPPYLD